MPTPTSSHLASGFLLSLSSLELMVFGQGPGSQLLQKEVAKFSA